LITYTSAIVSASAGTSRSERQQLVASRAGAAEPLEHPLSAQAPPLAAPSAAPSFRSTP